MDGSVIVVVVLTALTASAGSVVLCRWWFGRRVTELRHRLDKAEQARHAAHERSAQARVQIAQLSKAIAELQQRHRVAMDSQRKRADLERLVPSLPESAVLPASGFADTQPL